MSDPASTISSGARRPDPPAGAPTRHPAGSPPASRALRQDAGSPPASRRSARGPEEPAAPQERAEPAVHKPGPDGVYARFEVDNRSIGVVVRMVDAATEQVVRVIPIGHSAGADDLALRARTQIASDPARAIRLHASVQGPSVARLLEQ